MRVLLLEAQGGIANGSPMSNYLVWIEPLTTEIQLHLRFSHLALFGLLAVSRGSLNIHSTEMPVSMINGAPHKVNTHQL